MANMTGAQALVRSMQREGIRVMFGVPGAGQYEILDAIWETPTLRYVTVRHEQATTYMADGFARAGGGIASSIVLPGPGFLNSLAGMATASSASSPLLVVSGAWIFPNERPRDEGYWPMSKWTKKIERPAQLPQAVHEAMRQMRLGRPGPTLLQVSWKTLAAAEEVSLLEPEEINPPVGDPHLIRLAADLLLDSAAPVIMAGGGIHSSDASASLQKVAEHLQIPVTTSSSGKGAIPDDHPLSLGYAEPNYTPLSEWLAKCDVFVSVGTTTGIKRRLAGQQVICIDIDEQQVAECQKHDIGIAGDARITLESLYKELCRKSLPTAPNSKKFESFSRKRSAKHNQLEPQQSLMNAIRKAIPRDGIVVQGMNQMGYYSRNYLPVFVGRTYLTASHHGTLGHAFPVGLGAKIARPDRAVVILSGDGGFLYNSQELATAVQQKINVVVIVFNDNAYGNVLRAQTKDFKGHILGTRLHNPDFPTLARAYGAHGVKVEGADQLESVLLEALSIRAPTLIEVPVGEMDRVF